MNRITINYRSPTKVSEDLAICLGYFDGVHQGHKNLIRHGDINKINDGIDNYHLGVLTFDNPISKFVENGKTKEVLTSLEDRFNMIRDMKVVEYFIVVHIDKGFTELSPEEFIKMLEKINVKQIFVGSDYRFGKNQEGTIEMLHEKFIVNVLDIEDNVYRHKISSSGIARSISEGDIKRANKDLGYEYQITGIVGKGERKGREIGFPTINVQPIVNYVLPKFGVYKCKVKLNYLDEYDAICNVGVKPTIERKDDKPTIEAHLFNYSGEDLYGERVVIKFTDFIREEKKFDSIEELKAQMEEDIRLLTKKEEVKVTPVTKELSLTVNNRIFDLYIRFKTDEFDSIEKLGRKGIITIKDFLDNKEEAISIIGEETYNKLLECIKSNLTE